MSYSAEVLADTPVLYWRLGEPSGTNANDETANNLDGTYVSSPTLGVAGAIRGETDTAVTFDGSTNYVSRATDALIDFADGPLTLECWVNTTTTGQTLIGKGQNAYYMGISSGKLHIEKQQTAVIVDSTVTITDGRWHHCVYTKTGATSLVYVDGQDRTGTVTDATLANTVVDLNVGRRPGIGDLILTGSMDEVALYASVLTPARVFAHYVAGAIPDANRTFTAIPFMR